MDTHWEKVDETQGSLQAELLRGLLEAQGISVYLSQEGAGRAYGLTVGALGMVEILVPAEQVEAALQILRAYYAGEFTDGGPMVNPRMEEDGDEEP